jgi:hypothetical protein
VDGLRGAGVVEARSDARTDLVGVVIDSAAIL